MATAPTSSATDASEMKRTLSLTGLTINAMALIAPGAFLWTTFQSQSLQEVNGQTTAMDMVPGLLFALSHRGFFGTTVLLLGLGALLLAAWRRAP